MNKKIGSPLFISLLIFIGIITVITLLFILLLLIFDDTSGGGNDGGILGNHLEKVENKKVKSVDDTFVKEIMKKYQVEDKKPQEEAVKKDDIVKKEEAKPHGEKKTEAESRKSQGKKAEEDKSHDKKSEKLMIVKNENMKTNDKGMSGIAGNGESGIDYAITWPPEMKDILSIVRSNNFIAVKVDENGVTNMDDGSQVSISNYKNNYSIRRIDRDIIKSKSKIYICIPILFTMNLNDGKNYKWVKDDNELWVLKGVHDE